MGFSRYLLSWQQTFSESSMRSILYLILTILISKTLSQRLPLVSQWLAACKDRNNVTSAEIFDTDFTNDTSPAQNVKCFYTCALERAFILDRGRLSRFIQAGARALLNQSKLDSRVKVFARATADCFETIGVDECDLAFNFIRCMYPVLATNWYSN